MDEGPVSVERRGDAVILATTPFWKPLGAILIVVLVGLAVAKIKEGG